MSEPKSIYPLLCQAWGESDLPCAFLAYTEAEVRKFIVNEWWGDDTDERVDEVMSNLRNHDWKDEPEWNAEFEIGGVSFKPVYESNSRALAATTAPAPTEPVANAPRNIIWDSRRPDYPVEWSNPGRAAREGEVYAQRIDWLVSGDDGEDSFHRRLADDLARIVAGDTGTGEAAK